MSLPPSHNTSSVSLPLVPGESVMSSGNFSNNPESNDNDSHLQRHNVISNGNNSNNDNGSDQPQRDDDTIPWKNKNVRLSLALCAIQGMADSIWGAVVLSGFLFALGIAMGKESSDNTLVGAVEAVQGMTELVFALPIGLVADLYGKARIVACGGALMLFAIAVSLWAVTDAVHSVDSIPNAIRAYRWFLVALGLWGIVGGVVNGPSQALFADSIQKGKRSEMFTWLYSSYLVSSMVGPLVSIVLFLKLPKQDAQSWSMEEIYPVFVVGLLLEIPPAIIMFFFSDKHVVEEPDDTESQEQNEQSELEVPLLSENETATSENEPSNSLSLGKTAIPYFLFVSSLVVSLGSGASVKYFPLFFKELGFRSAAVQGIFVAVPLSIASFSFLAQRVSKRLGRVETTVLFDIFGTSLLFYMTYLSRDEQHLDMANKYLIVVIYVLRTGIMNSSYPLLESILMDNVPSNKRARWKSLESIAAFGWTGSALVGGVLADDHSYRFTFAITAALQLFGTFLLIPIQPFVESEVNLEDKDEEVVRDEECEENGACPEELQFLEAPSLSDG